MVPPWIGYSIWKFWVIRVLVSLVFHVFSTTELILHCKNSEFCRLSFSIIFLHDFILFGIDMHQNRSISLFKTLFDHFHFYPLVALKCYPHLIMCHTRVTPPLQSKIPQTDFFSNNVEIFTFLKLRNFSTSIRFENYRRLLLSHFFYFIFWGV